MTICFIHEDTEYRLEHGQLVRVRTTLDERGIPVRVTPFLARVEALATPGQWFYAEANGKSYHVPWSGFSVADDAENTTHLGRVAVSVKKDNALHFTLLPGGPGDLERCHKAFRNLTELFDHEADASYFRCEVAEPEFVKKQISSLHEGGAWKSIVLESGAPLDLSAPGPFTLSVHQEGEQLSIRATRMS